MKKILLAVFIILAGVMTTSAQFVASGSLDIMKQFRSVNLELDFSNAVIFGLSEQEYAEQEQDWYKDMPEIYDSFVKGLNLSLKDKIWFGNFDETPLTMKVKVEYVDKDGTFYCEVELIKQEDVVTKIRYVKSISGTNIGTSLRKIKVGANETGFLLGKFIKKQLDL